MIPLAQCVHKTTTRMRLRVPSRKGDRAFFEALQERLQQCDRITGSEVNPLTGGVLIFYTGDFAAIVEFAESRNIFRLAKGKRNPSTLMSATAAVYRNLDGRLKKFTGGELDLPAAAFLALMGGGVYQMVRKKYVSPAIYTPFWYALNIFLNARRKGRQARSSSG